jgi:hypothetical protein
MRNLSNDYQFYGTRLEAWTFKHDAEMLTTQLQTSVMPCLLSDDYGQSQISTFQDA